MEFHEASLLHRVEAAALALRLLPQCGKVEAAVRLARNVADLIPVTNRRFLDRSDQ
jgi:hypothetical protein